MRSRVIPCLLLSEGGLVKTVKFDQPRYVGDPINAVRIFNEKEVDELIFLDISAVRRRQAPDLRLIADIASEAFMPFAYGGGVENVDQVKALVGVGVEKVVINSAAVDDPTLVRRSADVVGTSSVVVSIDVRRSIFGKYEVVSHGGARRTGKDPVAWAQESQTLGAGELVITAVDRDGTMRGYDLELVGQVARAVDIPVIANGGAGKLADFADAVSVAGASAVAAGSMFVFHGRHRAVLITYPEPAALDATFACAGR